MGRTSRPLASFSRQPGAPYTSNQLLPTASDALYSAWVAVAEADVTMNGANVQKTCNHVAQNACSCSYSRLAPLRWPGLKSSLGSLLDDNTNAMMLEIGDNLRPLSSVQVVEGADFDPPCNLRRSLLLLSYDARGGRRSIPLEYRGRA
jgi:hypothetical protein